MSSVVPNVNDVAVNDVAVNDVAVMPLMFVIDLEVFNTSAFDAAPVPAVTVVKYDASNDVSTEVPSAIEAALIALIPATDRSASKTTAFAGDATPATTLVALSCAAVASTKTPRSMSPSRPSCPTRSSVFDTRVLPPDAPRLRLPSAVMNRSAVVFVAPWPRRRHEPFALTTSSCVEGAVVLIPVFPNGSTYRYGVVPLHKVNELFPWSESNVSVDSAENNPADTDEDGARACNDAVSSDIVQVY